MSSLGVRAYVADIQSWKGPLPPTLYIQKLRPEGAQGLSERLHGGLNLAFLKGGPWRKKKWVKIEWGVNLGGS